MPASPFRGVIVLCGGKSSRMGQDKASLRFGDSTLLQRIVSVTSPLVAPGAVCVVAAAGQILPPLPEEVQTARDREAAQGPLEGMAAGFRQLADRADHVYVTSCDVPLLLPGFVEFMFQQLESESPDVVDIAVPREERYFHPLAAVYRTSVLPIIEELLEAGQRRPAFLFERLKTKAVPTDELRRVDPDLQSLMNLNSPDDYQQALHRAGLSPEHRT